MGTIAVQYPSRLKGDSILKYSSVKKASWFFSGALGWIVKIIATILVISIVTAAICATVFALYIDNYIRPYIDNLSLSDLTLNATSFVYATDNETGEYIELEQLHSEENRIWVDYEDINQNMFKALVAVEDSRFYTHHGVDWVRTIGAMVNMVVPIRENYGGGSTITQQLIKNITGDDDVTVQRKIQEILRALEFEKNYTKEDILEYYLNTVYFGHGCYGIETAANTYFGVHASELTVAQAASIAGITRSPTYYDPLKYPERNKSRQELILRLMYDQGFIETEAEYLAAKNEELHYGGENAEEDGSSRMQSYYVDQVINDVIADLMEEYSYSETAATHLVYSGGYKIYANVDLSVQAVLDEVYQDEASFPDTESAQILQSAMVVMDPYTGRVLGMVGGVGEKTVNRAWNRATMTKRAPGSSIKPLTVYAPALEYGLISPASVFDDSPFDESTAWPKNQSRGYTGRMTVKRAVQNSTNTVAVKVLDMVSPERSFTFATVNLGLDLVRSEEINGKVFSDVDYAPLALGGLTNGLSVLDMTAAYCTFPNQGIYAEPTTYSRVVDSNGKTVLSNDPDYSVAMKEKTAYYMNNLLKNAVDNGTGRIAQIPNMAVAGKTGTTTNDHDRWFVGYTPYYCAAVWVGYDNQAEIKLSTSVNPAANAWKLVMDKLHDGLESKSFFSMETVQSQYCLDSGLLPTDACRNDPRGSRVTTGTFLPDDAPTKRCDVHVTVKICDESGQRASDNCKNTHEISLIKVDRTGNINMSDDAYLYRDAVYADLFGNSTESAYNTYCTYHSGSSPYDPNHQEEYPDDPEDDGSGIDNGDPDDGDSGGSTDDNGGSGNGQTGGNDGNDPPPWVDDDSPSTDDGYPTE